MPGLLHRLLNERRRHEDRRKDSARLLVRTDASVHEVRGEVVRRARQPNAGNLNLV